MYMYCNCNGEQAEGLCGRRPIYGSWTFHDKNKWHFIDMDIIDMAVPHESTS